MSVKASSVYQSGEKVHENGLYELVGAHLTSDTFKRQATVYEFHQGDLFPDYDGRAVCWLRLETADQSRAKLLIKH